MFRCNIEGLGDFLFYEHFFIGRVKEEVNADYQYLDTLTQVIQKQYSGKPIVYVSDRVNSYSLDATAATELIKRNNIRFVAVVTYSRMQKGVYHFEKQIIEGADLCAFDNLDAALEWAESKAKDLQRNLEC